MTLVPIETQSADLVVARYLLSFQQSTRASYATDLQRFFDFCTAHWLDPLRADRDACNAFALHLEENEGYAAATRARNLCAVHGFFEFMLSEGVLSRNPMASVTRPKLSDCSQATGLTRTELLMVLMAAKEASVEDFALISLLARNGLRISEALAIKWADFSEERGYSCVHITRKGGRSAVAPLSAVTGSAIRGLQRQSDNEYVFSGQGGGPISRTTAWRRLNRIVERSVPHKAGRISPHSLRHTFVTLSLEAGVPLHDVQDGAGHRDPSTTQRYNRARHRLENHPTHRLEEFLA